MINYYLLMKPGIIMGNLIAFAAGFLLASKGTIDFGLFWATLLGLGLIIAAACVFNNYIDRPIDKKMARTKNRPLVTGIISVPKALIFGTVLALLGNFFLAFYANFLTVLLADTGFLIYVLLYSLWKRKTVYGTAIGSIAGAVPPVVGYVAVTHSFDGGAALLFTLLVFWQMPHFFAIALYRLKDYAAAGVPVLPLKRGVLRTKIHMLFYIVGFIIAAWLMTWFDYTGYYYLAITAAVAAFWLVLCLKGFSAKSDERWGRQMFRYSLVTIMATCLMIPLDLQM